MSDFAGLFIDDGCTKTAAVKDVRGVYPTFTITYRPAVPQRVQKLLEDLGKPGADGHEVRVQFALKHLSDWSPTRQEGGRTVPVPLTASVLRKLAHQALGDVCDIVAGYSLASEGQESEAQADAKNS